MKKRESGVDSVSSGISMGREARRGFLAGVFGTAIMSVALLIGLAIPGSLITEGVPLVVMERLLGPNTSGVVLLLCTAVAHLTYGGFWGSMLAALMPPVTETRGVMLGIFLWLIEQLIVLPILGYGLFGTALEPTVAFVFSGTSFLFHLIYGQTYGMLMVKEVV